LDQNRATAHIAERLNVSCADVSNVVIWGNHSSTQFPDVANATAVVNGAKVKVFDAIKDDAYLKTQFVEVNILSKLYQIYLVWIFLSWRLFGKGNDISLFNSGFRWLCYNFQFLRAAF